MVIHVKFEESDMFIADLWDNRSSYQEDFGFLEKRVDAIKSHSKLLCGENSEPKYIEEKEKRQRKKESSNRKEKRRKPPEKALRRPSAERQQRRAHLRTPGK
ncbi:Hypothetical predicted protein, partial [Marmota monax]